MDKNDKSEAQNEYKYYLDKDDFHKNSIGIFRVNNINELYLDKDDVILYEVDKNSKETVRKAKTDPIINMPIVILTNENTASASEILAGALRDNGIAKIVGTKSYGKGVIQEVLT